MALADYRLCDVCESKCFYDANLDYDMREYPDTGFAYLGEWKVICRECALTHQVVIVERAEGGR